MESMIGKSLDLGDEGSFVIQEIIIENEDHATLKGEHFAVKDGEEVRTNISMLNIYETSEPIAEENLFHIEWVVWELS